MRTSFSRGKAVALAAMLLGVTAASGAAPAAPLPAAKAAAVLDGKHDTVQPVRHRRWGRWGGVGIYIGPGYGYGYSPRYRYGGYGYYPRYSRYYDDGYYDRGYYYDRPYRRYGRRWTRERFQHPLGRR